MPKYIHIILAPKTKIKFSFEESLKSFIVAIGILRNKYGYGQYIFRFQRHGYLFLASEAGQHILEDNHRYNLVGIS